MSEKLEKTWKQKLIATLGAAALTAPVQVHDKLDNEKKQIKTSQDAESLSVTKEHFSVPFGEHHLDDFLRPISYLESTGGLNQEHSIVNYGLHAGDAAIGKFGIMPKTARNVSQMLNNKNTILRSHVGDHFSDPEVQDLNSLSDDELNKKLKNNPKLQLRIARYLATHLDKLHQGDRDRMAFGWRFGHNRKPSSILDEHLNNSGYIKKFRFFHNYGGENK